jgi:hypothetical protein
VHEIGKIYEGDYSKLQEVSGSVVAESMGVVMGRLASGGSWGMDDIKNDLKTYGHKKMLDTAADVKTSAMQYVNANKLYGQPYEFTTTPSSHHYKAPVTDSGSSGVEEEEMPHSWKVMKDAKSNFDKVVYEKDYTNVAQTAGAVGITGVAVAVESIANGKYRWGHLPEDIKKHAGEVKDHLKKTFPGHVRHMAKETAIESAEWYTGWDWRHIDQDPSDITKIHTFVGPLPQEFYGPMAADRSVML